MIRIGDRQQFSTVRNFLLSAYPDDSEALAERVGDFLPERHQEEPALVRMLFLGRAIRPEEWEAAAPGDVRAAFSDLGLIEPASNARVRCSCLLYRMQGVYIASDRFMTDEGEVGKPAEDSVYYALTQTAQYYLDTLPKKHYDQILDLGSGSGAAALFLAPYANQIYSTDIAPRCVLFTEFNRLLNDFNNIEARQGNCYEPVKGLKFDLITCHPPFDISLSSKGYVYADGGEDGESLTRSVVTGLPSMLKPGGQFLGTFRATDRVDSRVEERLRSWLGEAGSEFDIAVVVRMTIRPEDHAISASMQAKRNLDEYERYLEFFKKLGVLQFVYTHVLIERKAKDAPLTLRREIGSRCSAVELEALLAWERNKEFADLASSKISPAPHMALNVRHTFKGGELIPEEYRFTVDYPCKENVAVPEWVAKLVALCVNGRTTEEIHSLMRKDYPIDRVDFDAAVKRLVSIGVLQLASGSKTISSN